MNSTTRVLVAATLAVFPMTLPAQAPAEVLRQSPPAPFPVPGDATAGAERSAASAAQQLLAQLPVVIRREADDRTGALQLHAVGRAYKASFHDGFRMGLPVGPTVATAPWLHWRTTAVLRGGVAQPLHEPVADVVDERRCEYDLGAVVEAYDVRPEGVEQTFVLREPGPGDLVVRGALGGDFVVAANEPRHGAVELRDRQGRRTLTYGAATAIDRNGETLPLETATSDGVIELRVPAAWLATAAYPIVVDPLLTPVLMWQTNYLDLVANTDIDRDDVNSSWNVGLAFDVAFSSVDYDSYFVLANDTYSAGHVIYSRASSGFEAWPKMAFVHAANQWALVFTQEWGPSQCYWRRHAGASTTNMSSQPATLVTSSSGEFQRRPVLGGTSGGASTGNYALLLRERDAGPRSGAAC